MSFSPKTTYTTNSTNEYNYTFACIMLVIAIVIFIVIGSYARHAK